MSVLNQSGEEQVNTDLFYNQVECPLCMEPFEVDDLHFYPCTCGYQICRFCWNRIREGENGLCPACRKAYPENPADFKPLSQEQVAAIKTEKKAREQKRRNKTLESRRALANVRVVQNNLVFVVGLPVRLADPETLKRQEYFGKYGKIHKVVINQSTTYAGSQGPSASAYVTYVSPADALRAIQGVNNVTLDGRVLKGSLGTTKYCANFMKNQPCPKPDCMYLHELGDPKASFTKEEMHAGLHQIYERNLHALLAPQPNTSGNSSTSVEKSSSKEGNPSNHIPAAVVTSSNINIVKSSKSKKDSGSANGNNSSNNNGNKEAWPSLGSSPPTSDSPTRKRSSPKPQHNAKSQENGSSENNSPTQHIQQRNKDHTEHKSNRCNKDISTNNNKKSKNTESQKKKSSFSESQDEDDKFNILDEISSLNDTDLVQESYLSNELDELESDRHSLLENHDLLDNSEHNLLENDNTHQLLDANSDVIMMHRHKQMLSGLVDNNHLIQMKSNPLVNGFGMMERESVGYLGNDRQISQSLMDKEAALLKERSRSEMLMRQNEMLARQHNVMVEPKHYMQSTLDSASELLGANYHHNPTMLPPFGMRVDSSIAANNMSGNSYTVNTMGINTMGINTLSNSMANTMQNNAFLMHNQHLLQNQQQLQQQQSGLVNGYDTPQQNAESRNLAENMDKFFMDFHKAQQRRLVSERMLDPRHHHMLSAERLEMEHKLRMGVNRGEMGARAAGDGDDDLDFDPFKETQKALAEMIAESEMQSNVNNTGDSLESVRRARLPPPGFSHMNAFGIGVPRAHSHVQGYSQNSVYPDWSQLDPAIVSTAVGVNKNVVPQNLLTQQQQELFARFNHLNVSQQPNGLSKHLQNGQQLQMLSNQHVLNGQTQWANQGQKLGWNLPSFSSVSLPPGFAPTKPQQHSAECIDAK